MGIVTAFMLPGTSYFREMCSCRRAVPVRRSTTRICRLAAEAGKGGKRGCASSRRRGLFGSAGEADGSFSFSLTLVLPRNGTEQDERGERGEDKVARNDSATVRSSVPDEQIRNMGGGNIDLS